MLNEVHRLIENRGNRFILTGSSAMGLRKQGTNLLAGRAYTYFLHSLTTCELGEVYSANTALQYGQLPSVWNEDTDKGEYLASYVRSYLEEEVLFEGLARNPGAFTRFLEAASFSQGSVFNISNIARDAAVERRTVSNYFDLLEDLLSGRCRNSFLYKTRSQVAFHASKVLFF